MRKWIQTLCLAGVLCVISQPGLVTAQVEANANIGKHSLTLPDGRVLTSGVTTEPTSYQGLHLVIETINISKVDKRFPFRAERVFGSGLVSVLKEEQITIPYGPAHLALVEMRDADGSVSRQYWMIAVGPNPAYPNTSIAYCINTPVKGDDTFVRNQLVKLANHWTLPITPLK